MFRHKRKGIALITVVLISALLFVSIIGITLKVVPENKIIAARSASERALTAAEAGISQVLFNLRNAVLDTSNNVTTTVPPNTALYLKYLNNDDVQNIIDGSDESVLLKETNSPNPYLSGTPAATYWVKITKNSDSGGTSNRTIGLTIDSMGIVFQDKNGNNALDLNTDEVLARKVVETTVTYEINITTTSTSNLKGAIISGGDINFIGNTNTVFTGDIYADGNIDFNSQSSNAWVVLTGSAYAHGYVDDGIVQDPSKEHENQPSNSSVIAAIINNFKWYVSPSVTSISDAFKNGIDPYDGTQLFIQDPKYPDDPSKTIPGYPNTNPSTLPPTDQLVINGIFQDYLGTSSNFGSSSSPGVANFYTDLFSGKILNSIPPTMLSARDFFTSLANTAYSEKFVTYFKGTHQQHNEVVDDGILSNVNYKLGGVLIIDGDLKIDGNPTINPDNNPLIVIVTGNVTLGGGGGQDTGIFNGSIFATSTTSKISAGNFIINGALVSPGEIDIGGNVTCNGTIVSQTAVRLNGTNQIWYDSSKLPTFMKSDVPITTNTNTGTYASSNPSSWKEIPYAQSSWQ